LGAMCLCWLRKISSSSYGFHHEGDHRTSCKVIWLFRAPSTWSALCGFEHAPLRRSATLRNFSRWLALTVKLRPDSRELGFLLRDPVESSRSRQRLLSDFPTSSSWADLINLWCPFDATITNAPHGEEFPKLFGIRSQVFSTSQRFVRSVTSRPFFMSLTPMGFVCP